MVERSQQENKENIVDASQASLAKSVPLIHNMEELYEALQRHGYVMPKFTC